MTRISNEELRAIDTSLGEINSDIIDVMGSVMTIKPNILKAIRCTKLKSYNDERLRIRNLLNKIDTKLHGFIKIYDGSNAMDLLANQLTVIFSVRNAVFVSLSEVDKIVSDIENKSVFQFNTAIALLAIVIASVSLSVAI
ncbi:hypothetical protein [Colwellia sp. Bg11-28]|uniref:hypothetical protein n=1 Tax=Colwellia sp. Bg11-28 TaxID=2058305 RepID=UPI000C326597|nr:hypothetical protein [Colwellia sp. Bg11-28]PKH86994.1 hypothetical protein CXF79_09715 [Colwellia sp. Bg11-28]